MEEQGLAYKTFRAWQTLNHHLDRTNTTIIMSLSSSSTSSPNPIPEIRRSMRAKTSTSMSSEKPWAERKKVARRIHLKMTDHDQKVEILRGNLTTVAQRKRLEKGVIKLRTEIITGKLDVLRWQNADGIDTKHSDAETLRLEEAIAAWVAPGETPTEAAVHKELSDAHRQQEIERVKTGRSLSREVSVDELKPEGGSSNGWSARIAVPKSAEADPIDRPSTPYPGKKRPFSYTQPVKTPNDEEWEEEVVQDALHRTEFPQLPPLADLPLLVPPVLTVPARPSDPRLETPTPSPYYSPTLRGSDMGRDIYDEEEEGEIVEESGPSGPTEADRTYIPYSYQHVPAGPPHSYGNIPAGPPPTLFMRHYLPIPYLRVLARDPSLPIGPGVIQSSDLETFYIEARGGTGFILAYNAEDFLVTKQLKKDVGTSTEVQLEEVHEEMRAA